MSTTFLIFLIILTVIVTIKYMDGPGGGGTPKSW
jgi:hypothetical protein